MMSPHSVFRRVPVFPSRNGLGGLDGFANYDDSQSSVFSSSNWIRCARHFLRGPFRGCYNQPFMRRGRSWFGVLPFLNGVDRWRRRKIGGGHCGLARLGFATELRLDLRRLRRSFDGYDTSWALAHLPAWLARQSWIARLRDPRAGVPYGIALAGAGLFFYPQSEIWQKLATS